MNVHTWNADLYHANSSAQQNAGYCLLSQVKISHGDSILDVGCGDGKITAMLARKYPESKIVGIDLSNEMISFAKSNYGATEYANLQFYVEDAEKLSNKKVFNLIFSCFALQWVADIEAFLSAAYQILTKDGMLAITIPLGISIPLQAALDEAVIQKEWQSYFIDYNPGWYFRDKDVLMKLMNRFNFNIHHCEQIDQTVVFNNPKHFEQYVFAWLNHLSRLPKELRPKFFTQLIDQYFKFQGSTKNGGVLFVFPRVDLIASKCG